MPNLVLFAEDSGHEIFLQAMIAKVCRDNDIKCTLTIRSASGGHGKMITELEKYIKLKSRGYDSAMDYLIVARDANCRGLAEAQAELKEPLADYLPMSILAIPDPHIERWFLLDSTAFKKAIGKGCSAPDHKCERQRYKYLFEQAIVNAGQEPIVGGYEHVESLVQEMDFDKMSHHDSSFKRFYVALLKSIVPPK